MNDTDSTPQRIAKYDIHCTLGSGAMGVVYKAYDSQIERIVAIKVLHDHLRRGEQGKELEVRFVQEARAAARCLHPNIVTIFDFGNEERPYIAMEYVEGVELHVHLKNDTAIPLHSATDITIQVLRALGHAHEKGVVHRDIKPSNIILLENGSIKVSDFGVARLDTSNLTGTGYLVGTPNYMSPEALLGQQVDARSDLYSVGVLFYEMLCRSVPLRGKSLDESLEMLGQVGQLSPESLTSIELVLRRALQPAPDDRYQTMTEFIADLEAIDGMDLTLAVTGYFPRPSNYEVNIQGPVSPASSSQWSADLLSLLEQSLAPHVGPMAKVLVKKMSRTSSSVDELVANLVKHIPNDNERIQFVRSVSSSGTSYSSAIAASSRVGPQGSTRAASRSGAVEVAQAITEDQQQALTRIFAFYAGPIAGRLVKKVCREHGDLDRVVKALGTRISDEREREKFILQSRDI